MARDGSVAAWTPATGRERGDAERDPEVLISESLAGREDGLRFATSLDAAACQRVGLHPLVGPLTIGDLPHEWITTTASTWLR